MVMKGQPKEYQDLDDLNKPGIRFVNRQRGAEHVFCSTTILP